MRVKDTVACDYPECVLEPTYVYGQWLGEKCLVCPRHRSWAEDIVKEEEQQ